MVVEFTSAVGPLLLVDPAPQGEVLRDAHRGLGVVGDGVQAGDVVLLPPAQQGLIAIEPHQVSTVA